MVHDGTKNFVESSALSSRLGRDATQQILKFKFY